MRRSTLLICVLGGIAVLAILSARLIPHPALLVWNASASAPVGLYLRLPEGKPARTDLVLVRLPVVVAQFAASRGYLPIHVPLIKRVVALAGDRVCSRGRAVFLNGVMIVRRQDRDRERRLLPHWRGCRTLTGSEIFLVMTHVPDSFDGRYFGPISVSAIEGRLVPLWTR